MWPNIDEIQYKRLVGEVDHHRSKASQIFNVQYVDVTDEQRRAGKAANYVEMYGGREISFVPSEFVGRDTPVTAWSYYPWFLENPMKVSLLAASIIYNLNMGCSLVHPFLMKPEYFSPVHYFAYHSTSNDRRP